MIRSMTGFGKASAEINGRQVTVELKSLNSKNLDVNTRLSGIYREKDLELRKHIGDKVSRGKVDISVYLDDNEGKHYTINHDLIKEYNKALQEIEDATGASTEDRLSILMKMPDVFSVEREELDENEWNEILNIVNDALSKFDEFRVSEGASIERDFREQVGNINDLLAQVDPFEEERKNNLRERIEKGLGELMDAEEMDRNRMEQEMIYYLEKLDINEEKVRLANHLEYFIETLDADESQGKKLGFISQEMGREINTLGSKANHSGIQRLVVQMKDNLERIKEQIANVL